MTGVGETETHDAGLADGEYDVIVVFAEASEPDGSGPDGADQHPETSGTGVGLELVVTAGSFKGHLLELRSTELDLDPLELLGLPGTVTITDGAPSLRLS